ncbi:hypothetical protein VTH06DRAFT_966 [Thermothelomyces fergusii]
MQLTTLALAALTSVASAQKVWPVTVAANGSLTFSPERLEVPPGDWVQFQFHAGNHTVTQSTFDQPCQPIGMHSNITGIHSGFVPVAASEAEGMYPTYSIQINDTKPLWLYCAQGKHCQKGMVMVINESPANATRTLKNFKALAASASTVAPGGSAGGDGTDPTGGGDGAGSDAGSGSGSGSGAGAGAGSDAGSDTGAGPETGPGSGADAGAGAEDGSASATGPAPSATGIIAGSGIVSAPSMFALVAVGAVALFL